MKEIKVSGLLIIVSRRFALTIKLEVHYVMALKGRCHIYETAFDSKVDKRGEESGDLIDRIANHPILQLLHIRRRSKPNVNSNTGSPSRNVECQSTSTFFTSIPSTSTDPQQQIGIFTPKSGRHSLFPARSSSTHHLSAQRLRPIGLSKSDDEILNRASDSPEDEDYLEDYREGSHTQDLANDLHSLHVTTHRSFAKSVQPPSNSPQLSSSTKSSLRDVPAQHPSPVHYPSAHFRPSDKHRIPSSNYNSSRPFASSLTKFGSRVQPKKYLSEPRVTLLQGDLSKSQLLPFRKELQPLKLLSPPGTAPLPVKFSKKTPNVEKSPSSWFSPIRQKDLRLPVKKSFLTRNEMVKGRSDTSSLNDSMVVLLDTGSQRDLKDCLLPPSVNVKYSSVDSMATGSAMSSLESLRSSMSDGAKSTASNESAISSYRSSSMGSDSSLVMRPFLNLNAPHRSLIQSAKFQILSPISDKSQEPSLETGSFSPKNSPQDLLELSVLSSHQKTPTQTPRNIQEDFRNVHHILPGPPPQDQPGSDSGISIEYKNHQNIPKHSQHLEVAYTNLPFDMPKLRRRLAAAKASLSSSNSSISSSAPSSDANVRFSLPSNALGGSPALSSLNPTISRLQVSCGTSRTSSSNSSDWDTRSSADSSEDQGTPKLPNKSQARRSLALELGCVAMSVKGQEVDTELPLTRQSWYHGVINRQEAEEVLRSHSEGSYIVRSFRSSKHDYSLALKSARGFMHFRLHFDFASGGYKIGRSDELFPSVPHIVSHFSVYRIPIKGAEHMVLLHPVPSETL